MSEEQQKPVYGICIYQFHQNQGFCSTWDDRLIISIHKTEYQHLLDVSVLEGGFLDCVIHKTIPKSIRIFYVEITKNYFQQAFLRCIHSYLYSFEFYIGYFHICKNNKPYQIWSLPNLRCIIKFCFGG